MKERVIVTRDGCDLGSIELVEAEEQADALERSEANLKLAIMVLPRLLEGYRPKKSMMAPQRFLEVIRVLAICLDEEQERNLVLENRLTALFVKTYGQQTMFHFQMRRASGESLCDECRQPYSRHRYERAVLNDQGQPYIHRLCNGDLVKL